MQHNPLLSIGLYPDFAEVKPEHIKPAITYLINLCEETVSNVLKEEENLTNPTWDSLITPVEEVFDRFDKAWGTVSHLNSVVSTDELRAAHDEMLPLISDFYTKIGQNIELYQAYKRFKDSDNFQKLNAEQQRAIELELKDFQLSGIALNDEDKKVYKKLSAKLSELASKFSNNVLDATNDYFKQVTDVSLLDGLPESAIQLAKQEAQNRGVEGYVLTLHMPSYIPVMQYAKNKELRKELYTAYVTRASELGPSANKFDNTAVIEEELELKDQLAKLLGFDTYADLSLATKMAENTPQVIEFLSQLASYSKNQAQKELQEIKDFAANEYGAVDLEPWDLSYYSELLKQKRYSISDEMIRPYFALPNVLKGLFELVSKIFNIQVKQSSKPIKAWHKDVNLFEIFNEKNELIGSFFTDLYAREKKNGGAWMDSCIDRKVLKDGSIQKPVAYLICNFVPPIGDKPSLLNHDEVETLFHEFGHCLHHLLTTVNTSNLAGIKKVPWDAVELPSQFMENFTWEPIVLDFLAKNIDTEEKLPKELLDNMIASKNYNSAMAMLRQIEFALFDFRIHSEHQKGKNAQEFLNEVREQVAVVPTVDFNRFQNGFTHIFAGGYAAGYYSYKWAEVLSADVFSKFEEEGILNPKVGKEYLDKILSKGGSQEFMDLFVNFRGRKPKVDALLRHSGIKQ